MELSLFKKGYAPAQSKKIMFVTKRDGSTALFEEEKIIRCLQRVCTGYEYEINIALITEEVLRTLFDGIATIDIEKALILAVATFIEQDIAYSFVAARLLLQKLLREIINFSCTHKDHDTVYRTIFIENIIKGVQNNLLDARMATFDLERLSKALKLERDMLLGYTGMYTLYERYFVKWEGKRLELPQTFWMRIAMGLALQESNKNERALEFYEVLSSLRYMPSTPTLFHAGFPVAQLSSCYLTTVNDDLAHIFKCLGDNAQLSKWAGGIGTDWSFIRGTGSFIKSIKATSQGVIPYLKIANDVIVAITRSGIRRGGKCAYLEVWHIDFEEFIDLRRNTGDERRRTHDMNIASWIPDLFMKRVMRDEQWSLFSPDEVPDLHDLYGKAFEERYQEYEIKAAQGKIKLFHQMSAKQLWRKMLTRLFETGHPWLTFKDSCNIRSPQDHVGVIHSSNLCTEVTLNTSADETAVCNLGSVNLGQHIKNGQLDDTLLEDTVKNAVRMLDNVIDLNFYPTKEAYNSNTRHRPIGLGLMGFQDALYLLDIPFSAEQALEFADISMEKIAYYAISMSCELAQEKGAYQTFKGSKWDRGIFQHDTLDLLEKERGMPIDVSRTMRLDWNTLKIKVKQQGMRNSNVMAIAPTATIATIAGCYPSIEPIYKNIYVKANISGEFTVINQYLINDLKKHGLWNQQMLDQLKYYDGDLALITDIPDYLKEKYKTAFELDPEWLLIITAVRSKWICQSQSHNVFNRSTSGQKMEAIYFTAWRLGLKTTYYYRTLGATQIEKSTLDAKVYGYTQKRSYEPAAAQLQPKACALENTDCESCQ
ncbi:MAG: ribonucleoside-diphosphate reductase subunit alpha [Candidatus Babeliaceae bacterium]